MRKMTQTFAGKHGNQVGLKKIFKVEYWEMIKYDLEMRKVIEVLKEANK